MPGRAIPFVRRGIAKSIGGRIVYPALFAAFGLVFGLPLRLAAEPPPGYRLVWNDEFGGEMLNTNKWRHCRLGPNRDGVNRRNAVRVEGGNLAISTYSTPRAHCTGMISTEDLFEFRYGYIEARIGFSDSPGMWSSFWLMTKQMGRYRGNPALSGMEVDICEHRRVENSGLSVNDQVWQVLHWDGYGEEKKTLYAETPALGLGAGYHTFGLEWTPSRFTFFVDATYSVTMRVPTSARPEYIVLCSEVADRLWCGGIPPGGYGNRAETKTRMKVDYVRVYQKPPVLSSLSNWVVRGGASIDTIPFHVSDAESAPWKVAVRGVVSAPDLLSVTNIAVSKGLCPWTSEEMGFGALPGNTWISGSSITLVGSGADIGARADAGRFLRQPLFGDGEMQVLLTRMEETDAEAKAGLMIRARSASSAKCAYVYVTPGGSVRFQFRPIEGGVTYKAGRVDGIRPPVWLKLVRAGDLFTAYYASNRNGKPQSWQKVGEPKLILMGETVNIGPAVTSHRDKMLCNALFMAPSGTILTGGERKLTISLRPGFSGTVPIKLVASDGTLKAIRSFSVSTPSAPSW